MAARFKVRESYTHDAAFMLKLSDAIERDGEAEVMAKRDVVAKLKDLSTLLLHLKRTEKRGK